jgi:ligand-binding sensor domain-containing protein
LYKPITTFGNIFPSSGLLPNIRNFYNDSQNNFWFGSFFNGMSCYNGKTITNYTFPNNDPTAIVRTDNNISRFIQDKAGNIWIATAGRSLIKFDGKSFFINNKSNGFVVDWVFPLLLADRMGNIWYNNRDAGVACFNGKETLSFTTTQGLCSNTVTSMFEDSNGTMWFGTENGLSCLKNGRFTTFNAEDGLANKSIHAITETFGWVLMWV